ncbi:MAG TPA: ATP-grasp domain-containing protein [Methylophaga sp.]|nr:ATP-grasp domain-containing protein [Methylophaga sp.]
MKIVVYEHFTSGALQGEALPAELAREGDAMLRAIVVDMLANTAFQPIILRDNRLADLPGAQNLSIANSEQYQQIWQQCLSNETLFLLIAPETDGVLQQLAEAVLKAGKTLLGSSPEAIAVCSDKLRCSQFLLQHDLPTVETQSAGDWLNQPLFSSPIVCKPNDGAGCVETYYFAEAHHAVAYLQKMPDDKRRQQIVQPFYDAQAMSLSLFIDRNVQILSLNRQLINIDQQFSYQGSQINVSYPAIFSQAQAQTLVAQLSLAMPGLSGFVGIDILIDQQQARIIDINPRLTSSFNQLQQSELSPAALLYHSLGTLKQGAADG